MYAGLWLISTLLLFRSVISFDPSLSNGTCYYAPGKQAADNFIPCGNAAGGVISCCQARDVCLSSNACFNIQNYVTYVAGCTDEQYGDPACPHKGDFSDQQWVGLVRCHVSNGAGEEWGPCDEPDQPELNKGNQQCTCDASASTAVFTDAATLTNIASLPVRAGNAIAWSSGFEPSTTISDSTTTGSHTTPTSLSTSAPTTVNPGATASATSAPVPTGQASVSMGSLSTSAKAGIGVGVAVGVMSIGALVLFWGWRRRQKRRSTPPIRDQIRPSSTSQWGIDVRELMGGRSSTIGHHRHLGARSELPTEANETTTAKTSLGEHTTTTTRSAGDTASTAYRPYQHSPTAEASEMDASPAASTSRLNPGRTFDEKQAQSGPIYEMPG